MLESAWQHGPCLGTGMQQASKGADVRAQFAQAHLPVSLERRISVSHLHVQGRSGAWPQYRPQLYATVLTDSVTRTACYAQQ